MLGELSGVLETATEPNWNPESAICVVLAAEGYPGSVTKGDAISGVEDARSQEGVEVFHAGTKREVSGDLVCNGGRVLNVTALGAELSQARERVYAACDSISFRGKQIRRDIGAQD